MNDKRKHGDVTFLFGAGAELAYGLPLGSEFTNRTMLCQRSKMYDALEQYYKDENIEGYKKVFMFSEPYCMHYFHVHTPGQQS